MTDEPIRELSRYLNYGKDCFSDRELLRLLLRHTGEPNEVRRLADDLIDRYGGIYSVFRMSQEELGDAVGGNPEALAALLLVRDVQTRRIPPQKNARDAEKVTVRSLGEQIAPRFSGSTAEESYLLCLDSALHSLGCYCLAKGAANAVAVATPMILHVALRVGASACILAHNHPCTAATASHADRNATERIFFALDSVNVLLLDHLIVAEGKTCSMEEEGFFRYLHEKRARIIEAEYRREAAQAENMRIQRLRSDVPLLECSVLEEIQRCDTGDPVSILTFIKKTPHCGEWVDFEN